jgi:hypothetical protein
VGEVVFVTVPDLERNLEATLGLALIAGLEDERFAELGGNASILLALLQSSGGLKGLIAKCEEAATREGG